MWRWEQVYLSCKEDRVPGEGKYLFGSNIESEEISQFVEKLMPVKEGRDKEKFREEVLMIAV